MVQIITDHWKLIIFVIIASAIAVGFLLTDKPESNKDMHKTTQEVEEILRARKEARIRTEAQNKAEAKYISDYFNAKDETIIF